MLDTVEFRTRVALAKVYLRRLTATPDRLRRRILARRFLRESVVRAPVKCLRSVNADGFTDFQLDSGQMCELMSAWHTIKATGDQAVGSERSTGKPFFEELLSSQSLQTNQAFIEVALNESVLMTVMEAMGMLPHLESVDILNSSPRNGTLLASQLWHHDVNDERIIKLFVYLEDCGPRNGPFTYIAASDSKRVPSTWGHYIPDEQFAKEIPKTHWKNVQGHAGTGFLIDTGRCYHFGSRCELPRVAYIATYSSGIKYMRRARSWNSILQRFSKDWSPLQRAVCGLSTKSSDTVSS